MSNPELESGVYQVPLLEQVDGSGQLSGPEDHQLLQEAEEDFQKRFVLSPDGTIEDKAGYFASAETNQERMD